MKTPERFTQAITKLYNAFHKGELNAMDCTKCAVGNMCDGSQEWASSKFREVPLFVEKYELARTCIAKTGYSEKEVMKIEDLFMTYGIGGKQKQFRGLCAVVEYLCELEGISNIMDYSKLFETENNEPKHQFETVF